MINGLDLFTGTGGMSIALREWVRPIAYCEIDPYCQGILLSRMSKGEVTIAPIWDDIKTLQSSFISPTIDIIYGGFPCQDISVAGLGKGLEGKRSGLFFEIMRLAKEIKPPFIFLENVPAITCRGGIEVVRQITEMGYDCRWCVISAASVGARHKRDRWFLLAHSLHYGSFTSKERRSLGERITSGKRTQEQEEGIRKVERASGLSSNVANSRFICKRCEDKSKQSSFHHTRCCRFWETEPDLDRVADGVQFRTHRIRALGNAVVPQQAKEAFEILIGLK